MSLVQFVQSLNSSIFNIFATALNLLFSHMMFVFLFAIVFLLVNKNIALKLGYCYGLSFLFGGVFLKNVVDSPMPYVKNPELFASRTGAYWGSCPSLRAMNVSGLAGVTTLKTAKKQNKWWLSLSIFLWIVGCFCVGLVAMYNAEAYIFDILLGAVLGALVYILFFHFVKKIPRNAYSLLSLVVPIGVLFLYFSEWDKFVGHEYIFDACGFLAGLILFSYLENKFIKYEIKNNIFFVIFKILTIMLVLLFVSWISSLFSKIMIVRFVYSFCSMAVVLLLFPFIFKLLGKYFYCFSKDVNLEKVVFSEITFGEKGTNKVAKKFAGQLVPSDFVVLQGDLGAGKTVFTRAILREKNVKNNITSPTFTILNEYNDRDNNFYHFDMYRLTDESEIDNIGFFDAINDKKGIVFVEWAENIADYLPPHYKKITIVKLGKNMRNIILEQV